MPYNYSPGELEIYRQNPNRRMPASIGRQGQTYAQYMAGRGGGDPQAWLDADTERRNRETQAATEAAAKPSQAMVELLGRRDTVRKLYADYGKDALAENARTTGRELAGVDTSTARRGLYSTTVRDALRNRAMESGARSRTAIQGQVAMGQANAENWLTGDIANQYSHENDVKAGYANALAAGDAERKAREKSSLYGFLGTLGGGLLGGLF